MIVTHEIRVDLLRPGIEPRIYAVQDDKYSRDLRLSLFAGGVSWKIPDGTSALVRYRKPDGTGGTYDTLPDGTTAWSAVDNVLTVALAPQVLTVAGPVYLAVTLIKGKQQITTFSVILHVQPDVSANVGESENYINVTGFLPAPQSAKIGQFVRVAAVDENGNVTAVETVDAVGGAVQSVNGQTGTVTLTAAQVGADASGTAAGIVSSHNTNSVAHNDMRIELKSLADRLNAFFDSDDTTLDELSEIVEYIKSNKSLIEAVTTSKVNVVDIIDNLTTNVSNKPLSAAQGVVLKGLYDALKDSVDNMGPDLFVGTENTTVAEFNEAFASGKPCFLMKATAGSGITMWVAYSCGTNRAYFYRVAPDGVVQYGTLDSAGNFTYETSDVSGSGESNVFIGNNDTTLAEFKAAYDSGKTCFLRRSNPSGDVTYTAHNVTSTNAFFFAINTTGAIIYASLDSSNAFTVQERKHVTTIDQNSTDEQIPTAKAVYDYVNANSGGGLTATEKSLILTLFRNAAYASADMNSVLTQLEALWSGSGGETGKTLTSISATYSGGDVAVGTAVTALTGVVVTAHYSDGTSEAVTGYTLSGTIAEGSNTITVSYGGKTTTFTVTGVAESTGGNGLYPLANGAKTFSNGTVVTVGNGNHVVITIPSTAPGGYINLSDVTANSDDVSAASNINNQPEKFALQSGDNVVLSIINRTGVLNSVEQHKFDLRNTATANVLNSAADKSGSNENYVVEETLSAAYSVGCLYYYFSAPGARTFEFDVSLTVNGEKYI